MGIVEKYGRDSTLPDLPKDLGAEQEVIGEILYDPAVLPVALELVGPDDFYLRENAVIIAAVIQVAQRNEPVAAATIINQLQRVSLFTPEIGAYLSQVTEGIHSVRDIKFFARRVKNRALLRSVNRFAVSLQEKALAADSEPDAVVAEAVAKLSALKASPADDWKKKFHTVEELPTGDAEFLIDRIAPAGVIFIGGLSGVGKTWFALSMVIALIRARKFLGVFFVPQAQNVLYLCPEMNARTFRKRCERFGISGERFRCVTIADGAPLDLADPQLLAAIREMKPVVFLDTAIRFSCADDENSASENAKGLGPAIFSLLHAGARAVVCLHHRGKDSGRDEMTLENALRGTSDLGAVADCVWGLQYDRGNSAAYFAESRKLVRLSVRCVKARDFCPPEDFRIQLDPFLDSTGDLAMLTDADDPFVETEAETESRLAATIAANPAISKRELERLTGIGRNRVDSVAARFGWIFGTSGWTK